MTTANTFDCFREFVGCRVVGVIRDTLPLSDQGIARGTKTLIFEDGRGLTITSHGTFWVDSVNEVKRAVDRYRVELERTSRDLSEVVELAGAP